MWRAQFRQWGYYHISTANVLHFWPMTFAACISDYTTSSEPRGQSRSGIVFQQNVLTDWNKFQASNHLQCVCIVSKARFSARCARGRRRRRELRASCPRAPVRVIGWLWAWLCESARGTYSGRDRNVGATETWWQNFENRTIFSGTFSVLRPLTLKFNLD